MKNIGTRILFGLFLISSHSICQNTPQANYTSLFLKPLAICAYFGGFTTNIICGKLLSSLRPTKCLHCAQSRKAKFEQHAQKFNEMRATIDRNDLSEEARSDLLLAQFDTLKLDNMDKGELNYDLQKSDNTQHLRQWLHYDRHKRNQVCQDGRFKDASWHAAWFAHKLEFYETRNQLNLERENAAIAQIHQEKTERTLKTIKYATGLATGLAMAMSGAYYLVTRKK